MKIIEKSICLWYRQMLFLKKHRNLDNSFQLQFHFDKLKESIIPKNFRKQGKTFNKWLKIGKIGKKLNERENKLDKKRKIFLK